MRVFEYRAYYDLELDFCPEEHGFWLDPVRKNEFSS
jgi:hypothetical protein